MRTSELLAGRPTGTFAQFFDREPKARAFVLEWRQMRDAGTTDWSLTAVLRHLRSKHGCALTSKDALIKWLRTQENP